VFVVVRGVVDRAAAAAAVLLHCFFLFFLRTSTPLRTSTLSAQNPDGFGLRFIRDRKVAEAIFKSRTGEISTSCPWRCRGSSPVRQHFVVGISTRASRDVPAKITPTFFCVFDVSLSVALPGLHLLFLGCANPLAKQQARANNTHRRYCSVNRLGQLSPLPSCCSWIDSVVRTH
jgi:hypothetical protein